MNSVELGNPASKKVGCFSASALRKLEKSGTWLHIAALVSDDGRKHAAASGIFCLGDLTQEVSEPRIVLCDADGVNVSTDPSMESLRACERLRRALLALLVSPLPTLLHRMCDVVVCRCERPS